MEPKAITAARREMARHPAGKPWGAALRRRAAMVRDFDAECTRPLYLIACSGSKLDHAAPALELYTGQAFRFAVRAAADGDILILSALHGLVEPDTVLEPYNVTLSTMSAADRAAWAETVADDLDFYAHRPIVVLAGADYAAACSRLPRADYPLKGLGIGMQLQCLKNMVQDLENEAAEERAFMATLPDPYAARRDAAAGQLSLF